MKNKVRLGGIFTAECFDKDGNLKWKTSTENIVTNEGLNHMLDVLAHGTTQISPWYVLVFETDTTPAAGTTYAVPVFTESEAYDEATRPEYVEAAAASQSITNSANKATFTFNATKTIYGAALVGGGTDGNTKGDVAGGGTMLAAGAFTAGKAVVSGEILYITYTLTGSSS